MENLKKNLNAQTHVFGNFQFWIHKARNHLPVVVHKMYPNSRFCLVPCWGIEW